LENIYFTEILPGQKINRTFHPDGEVDFIDIFLNTQVLQDCVTGDVPENVHLGGNSQIDSESFSWTWVHFQGIFQILQ
jgi:hypothetical protein